MATHSSALAWRLPWTEEETESSSQCSEDSGWTPGESSVPASMRPPREPSRAPSGASRPSFLLLGLGTVSPDTWSHPAVRREDRGPRRPGRSFQVTPSKALAAEEPPDSGTGLPGPSHPQPVWFCSHSARRGAVASGKSPGFDTRRGAIIIIFNYMTVPLPGRQTGQLSPLLTREVPFPFTSTDINSTHALGISELRQAHSELSTRTPGFFSWRKWPARWKPRKCFLVCCWKKKKTANLPRTDLIFS